MKIWIDADACPKVIKEILFRAAQRTETMLILVSNHAIAIPNSAFITRIQVPKGFDVADNKIIERLEVGDLVITGDIPLADAVVSRGCLALNPYGELYTVSNIKERLSLRNFSHQLRSSNVVTGGPSGLNKKEIQNFANNLDRILTK